MGDAEMGGDPMLGLSALHLAKKPNGEQTKACS